MWGCGDVGGNGLGGYDWGSGEVGGGGVGSGDVWGGRPGGGGVVSIPPKWGFWYVLVVDEVNFLETYCVTLSSMF